MTEINDSDLLIYDYWTSVCSVKNQFDRELSKKIESFLSLKKEYDDFESQYYYIISSLEERLIEVEKGIDQLISEQKEGMDNETIEDIRLSQIDLEVEEKDKRRRKILEYCELISQHFQQVRDGFKNRLETMEAVIESFYNFYSCL